ncbi:hypothetical protein GBA63_18380 [Rubrobacter tropicus]|uniref:Uncharacterized protein n=1 Tax=Rubrobacter tropicus TaxID=2653851 RepID=A0A6G8QD31_9ACTN|nr:hypothetical protein [Rubrobacter tropicus]QIN84389.1 hypothetical protein GBA63_18380 [Rubrobacter tropicus]
MTVETAAPTVAVLGEDSIVGNALELLLCGSGYDARFEALRTFDAGRTLRGVRLVLLAPGLDEWDRGAVLSSVEAACREGGLPILELVSATISRPGRGRVLIPWPCRTKDLEREIDNALLREQAASGRRQPSQATRIVNGRDHRTSPYSQENE